MVRGFQARVEKISIPENRPIRKFYISRLKAERMEVEVTLFKEQDETDKIREDIRNLEILIQRLRGAQFG